MNTEFVKQGNRILSKPQGFDYSLIDDKVYNLMWDNWSDTAYLEEDGELNMPPKLYTTPEDDFFVKRVLHQYISTTKLTTGVVLAGTKGTGKTVMAKIIAEKSGLPIIVVNEKFPERAIKDFFIKFKTPVCVILDEVEKNWNTERLLSWLDGVQSTAKKLVLMTCNEYEQINEYLKDRCSRIRYLRKFEASDNVKFIKSIIADKGIVDEDGRLYEFIKTTFTTLSIDNILSFLDEVLLFPELSFEQVLQDMNIVSTSFVKSNEDVKGQCKESSTTKGIAGVKKQTDSEFYRRIQSTIV